MQRGFRGPLQQQTPRTRPPYVDLVWPGMQWFLRPGRVLHPDKPDWVRMPDPGGGRFREWFSNFPAALSPGQIERGKINGFWLTYHHRLASQIDTEWKARLRPGPDDAWQRSPASAALQWIRQAAEDQGMVHVHLGADLAMNLISPFFAPYISGSLLHEYYFPAMIVISDLDCLPGRFGREDPPIRDWPKFYGHPSCPDPKVLYTSEDGGLWNAGWLVVFNTPPTKRIPASDKAGLSLPHLGRMSAALEAEL